MSADAAGIARRALVCLDLTNLDDGCTPADVEALCRRAQTNHGSTAAVCVWPRFAAQAKGALAHTGVKVACVVNFPSGGGAVEAVVAETRAALEAGADEIDVVVPWAGIAARGGEAVTALVAAVKAEAGERAVKAILETGMLRDPALVGLAAEAALDGGADFLKTSTGKVAVNATPDAAEILLRAIARRGGTAGFKASGGVRSVAEAGTYLGLCDSILGHGWAGPRHFRIGASGLLDALLAVLDGAAGADADDEDY